MPTPNMTEAEMDDLGTVASEAIELIHGRRQIEPDGRAATVFTAIATFLQERGILDELRAAAADSWRKGTVPKSNPQN
jgi:hypothetical protein